MLSISFVWLKPTRAKVQPPHSDPIPFAMGAICCKPAQGLWPRNLSWRRTNRLSPPSRRILSSSRTKCLTAGPPSRRHRRAHLHPRSTASKTRKPSVSVSQRAGCICCEARSWWICKSKVADYRATKTSFRRDLASAALVHFSEEAGHMASWQEPHGLAGQLGDGEERRRGW